MIIDQIGNVINDIDDVVNHLLSGGTLKQLQSVCYDSTAAVYAHNQRCDKMDLSDWIIEPRLPFDSATSMDQRCQNQWLLPQNYIEFDIVAHLVSLCHSDKELARVEEELKLFVDRDLLPVLRAIKYLVDTMKSNGIIWGVGRGSSVASYCLYLLEAHSVDSIKYGLDFKEFLD